MSSMFSSQARSIVSCAIRWDPLDSTHRIWTGEVAGNRLMRMTLWPERALFEFDDVGPSVTVTLLHRAPSRVTGRAPRRRTRIDVRNERRRGTRGGVQGEQA